MKGLKPMSISSFLLIFIFVIINIIQTWLMVGYKRLIRGGIIIGGIEAVEFLLVIYILTKGETMTFLAVVLGEIIQWLSIAYLSLKR
ncbi:MAG: hypothetical protein V1841_01010 [Patescibacteria group bacterium]